jgi:hypothetical protein
MVWASANGRQIGRTVTIRDGIDGATGWQSNGVAINSFQHHFGDNLCPGGDKFFGQIFLPYKPKIGIDNGLERSVASDKIRL